MTTISPDRPIGSTSRGWFTASRQTALLYLGLAISGLFTFLFARAAIAANGDAAATTANFIQQQSLARAGIAGELAVVAFQALAAAWFYRLFSRVDAFAAGLIGVFGTVNAVAILIATAAWHVALKAALAGHAANDVLNLFVLHDAIWLMAGLFFGLWLMPMGVCVARTRLPRALAWLLIIGGAGYVLQTLVNIVLPGQTQFADLLVLPATVAEFWVIGSLLWTRELVSRT